MQSSILEDPVPRKTKRGYLRSLLAAVHIRTYDVIGNVDAFFSIIFAYMAAAANNFPTLGRLEKLKIAARPARIDPDDDVDISILKK